MFMATKFGRVALLQCGTVRVVHQCEDHVGENAILGDFGLWMGKRHDVPCILMQLRM